MTKNNSQNGSAFIVVIIVIVVLVLGGLGYVVWNNFFRVNNETTQQTNNDQNTAPDVKDDIKTTLPNGKTATYPDTEGNRNIVFLAKSESDNPNYVRITHKGYEKYLDSLGEGKVDVLCGPDDNLKALKDDILYGLLNTTDKTITYPQNWNCVELIASDENPDAGLRPAAQEVLDQIKADVNAFLESVTIQ